MDQTLSTDRESRKTNSCKATNIQKVAINYEYNHHQHLLHWLVCDEPIRQNHDASTWQDAKRNDLYSSETYCDEYGRRAKRANVINFILAVFGIRMNKKV
jgi:hypothetical protein